MKKALLLMASPRAGWSDGAAETLAEILAEKGVEVRTAAVREEEIGYCRGCGACMGRGEKACPMSGWCVAAFVGNVCRRRRDPDAQLRLQVPALLKTC